MVFSRDGQGGNAPERVEASVEDERCLEDQAHDVLDFIPMLVVVLDAIEGRQAREGRVFINARDEVFGRLLRSQSA